VSHSAEKPKCEFLSTRPETISSTVWELIEPATVAAQKMQGRAGSFEIYEYLSVTYKTYRRWKRRKVAQQTAHRIAHQLDIPWRKGISPLRTLIEATLPSADAKQKSRWVRALQFAWSKDTPASDLNGFFRARGGIAGCARLAAKKQPKQEPL
jgi:hypothetical protein